MRKASRKQCRTRKTEPTPDLIRRYIQCSADEHHLSWQAELTGSAPHWTYMLGLHLRLIELEHLEAAAGELL
jgi:hypothetical protein